MPDKDGRVYRVHRLFSIYVFDARPGFLSSSFSKYEMKFFELVIPKPGLSLVARIKILLDEKYAERADYTSFTGDRYFPGEPRSLYLGVERTW